MTRPAKQAGALAERIAALGRQVTIFPLLDIQPLVDDSALKKELERLTDYAMAAFVSPNAIDAVFSRLTAWPDGVAIAVVGPGSRRALERHGLNSTNATIYSPVRTDRTDSETLLEALDLDTLRGRKVLILRGESGRELLADALRSAGAQVVQVASYRRLPPQLTADRRSTLQALLDAENDWIVTSSEALGILLNMADSVAGLKGVQKMQHQSLIVPHVRIKEYAESMGFQHICLTGSGDDSVLAALQSSS